MVMMSFSTVPAMAEEQLVPNGNLGEQDKVILSELPNNPSQPSVEPDPGSTEVNPGSGSCQQDPQPKWCQKPPPKPECKDGQVKDKDDKCVTQPGKPGDSDVPDSGSISNPDSSYGSVFDSGYGSDSGSSYGSSSGSNYSSDPDSGYGSVFDSGYSSDFGSSYASNIPSEDAPTSTEGNAGDSVKQPPLNPVAKSLPSTGGGWVFLVAAGATLTLAGGFLTRRFSK